MNNEINIPIFSSSEKMLSDKTHISIQCINYIQIGSEELKEAHKRLVEPQKTINASPASLYISAGEMSVRIRLENDIIATELATFLRSLMFDDEATARNREEVFEVELVGFDNDIVETLPSARTRSNTGPIAMTSDDEEEGTEEQEFPKHDSNSDQSEELTYLRMMLEDLALHESLASALSQMNVSSIEDLIHAVQHSPDELRAIGMTDQDLLNINNYVDKHVEDEGESTANSTQPASIVGV